MSLQSGSATFSRFTVEPPAGEPRRWLLRGLTRGRFQPLDLQRSEEDRAVGFTARDPGEAGELTVGAVTLGEWALFAWRVDAVRVPASAVKAELARWEGAFVRESRRPPSRTERAAARDGIRRELRLRTPVMTRTYDVTWSLASGELLVWTTSRRIVDEVSAAIEAAFGAKLSPRSPAGHAAARGLALERLSPTRELVGAPRGDEVAP